MGVARSALTWSLHALLIALLVHGCHSMSGEGAQQSPSSVQHAGPQWRSALYPTTWVPVDEGGVPDAAGRYLPDFSYAGWHRGEARPAYGKGPTTVTVAERYGDGHTDATMAIQSAIDAVCGHGGGTVRIPTGTFVIRLPQPEAKQILSMACSHIVLRGSGSQHTQILVDAPRSLRGKAAIAVGGTGSIDDHAASPPLPSIPLAVDVPAPSTLLHLSHANAFQQGDWIVVRSDDTAAFRADHRMDQPSAGIPDLWPPSDYLGLVYPRRVVSVHETAVQVDGPIPLPMRRRDQARAYRAPTFTQEVGLESFAIGMIQNATSPNKSDAQADNDFQIPGTTGFEVHAATAIVLDRIHDAWIFDVQSFAPSSNTRTALGYVPHLLSIGLQLGRAASRITVDSCAFMNPEYRGGGGNGYTFAINGTDALVVDSLALNGRHGFVVSNHASGNVFLRDTGRQSRFADDTHRYLSNANLYDNFVLDGDWLQSVNRGQTSTGAGFTGTQNVYWNTQVLANPPIANGCAVESAQWGYGYLIGSRGAPEARALLCPKSFTNKGWAELDQGDPIDWVEGAGEGRTLVPLSLYADQLARRCLRHALPCIVW